MSISYKKITKEDIDNYISTIEEETNDESESELEESEMEWMIFVMKYNMKSEIWCKREHTLFWDDI